MEYMTSNIIFCGIAAFFAGLYFGSTVRLKKATVKAENKAKRASKIVKEFEDFLHFNGTIDN